jgi:Amt family ammonium transporter
MIPLSSGADRWRLAASCASAPLLAGFTFPLFAHWSWGGGWLAQLGANYGFGQGFVDCGGAGAIQAVGGLSALSIAWILGPRRGKFSQDGMPTAIPGHNAVLIVFGCFLGWLGWMGLDAAGALLFAHAVPGQAVLAAMNATLGATAASLVGALITKSRFGKTDASLTANAWFGGLVATSAGCALMAPAAGLLTGLVAGVLVVYAVDWLELHLKIDDPGGAVSVHGLCGLWGVLAAGIFARSAANVSGQWIAQVIGAATLIGCIFPLTYGLNCLLARLLPHRIHPEGERQGLDLYELGAGAYPEFLSHNDDLWQR